MFELIRNPALWASIGSLLAAIGLEMVPAQALIEHIIALVAAVSGLIGILQTLRSHGYRIQAPVKPEPPTP